MDKKIYIVSKNKTCIGVYKSRATAFRCASGCGADNIEILNIHYYKSTPHIEHYATLVPTDNSYLHWVSQ